jgi:hypothetical protein
VGEPSWRTPQTDINKAMPNRTQKVLTIADGTVGAHTVFLFTFAVR